VSLVVPVSCFSSESSMCRFGASEGTEERMVVFDRAL
jgi:hypothetical protein